MGDQMVNRVREFRQHLGLSIRQLHDATQISIGLLSGIERGKHVPNVVFAQRLARALGTNIETLFPTGDLPTSCAAKAPIPPEQPE